MLDSPDVEYAYFFFYSFLRTSYIKRLAARVPTSSKTPVLSTAAELSLGAAAGALSQIFTIPVSVIATRQQVGRSSRVQKDADIPSPSTETNDDSFFGVAREIVREDGVTGLWLGIKPGMVLTVNPAITYGVYERLKSILLLARADKLTPGMTFLLGAFSKTLATIVSRFCASVCELALNLGQVTYPYIMAKVRIQARTAERVTDDETGLPQSSRPPTKATPTGAVGLLMRVLETEGVVGWYQVRPHHDLSGSHLVVYPSNRLAHARLHRACRHRLSRRCSRKPCCSFPRSSLNGGH